MMCAYLTTVAKSPPVVSSSNEAGDTVTVKEDDMPKGPQGQKRPADVIGNAVHVAKIATGEAEETGLKQPAKRSSGLAGAKARTDNLTKEERSEIAKIAALKRWKQ